MKYNMKISETLLIDDLMCGRAKWEGEAHNLFKIEPFIVVRYVESSVTENLVKSGFQFNIDAYLDKELMKCQDQLLKLI
jgi:hypothetical protein